MFLASKCVFAPFLLQIQPVSVFGSWGYRAESATSAVWGEAAIETCDQELQEALEK